jgi:hypothetical protein
VAGHSLPRCYERHATGDHATFVLFFFLNLRSFYYEIVFMRASNLGLELALCNRGALEFLCAIRYSKLKFPLHPHVKNYKHDKFEAVGTDINGKIFAEILYISNTYS